MNSRRIADGMANLVGIRRGVKDVERTAEFFGWLLNVTPVQVGPTCHISYANGELLLHEDVSEPVAIELDDTALQFRGRDPDDVYVATSERTTKRATP